MRIVILCVFVPFVLWGQTPTSSPTTTAGSSTSELFGLAFEAILGLVVLVLGKGGYNLFKVLEAKTGKDIPDPVEKELGNLIDLGLNYAAEQGHKRAKESGDKMKGNEKLDAAAKVVLSLAKNEKIKSMAEEQIKTRIEAKLGAMRANGTKPN